MKIKELGHIAFTCQDVEASIAFYRDILEFPVKFSLYYSDIVNGMKQGAKEQGVEPDPEQLARFEAIAEKPWITYVEIGRGQFLELFDAGEATVLAVPDGNQFNYQHMALVVENIHEMRDELVKKGVIIDIEPAMGMEGTWQMWIHDPDGNKIEFMQYTENSMQLIGRADK